MFWIITQDTQEGARLGKGHLPYSNAGPHGRLTPDDRRRWTEDYLSSHGLFFPYEFRLLDDDGNVEFLGRCGDLDQADGDAAFAPLDWAEGDVGATSMEYRKVGEVGWKQL